MYDNIANDIFSKLLGYRRDLEYKRGFHVRLVNKRNYLLVY